MGRTAQHRKMEAKVYKAEKYLNSLGYNVKNKVVKDESALISIKDKDGKVAWDYLNYDGNIKIFCNNLVKKFEY